MTKIETIEDALAFVQAQLNTLPSATFDKVAREGNTLELTAPSASRGLIEIKAGEPQRDVWSRRRGRPLRMEQITITAPNSKRSHYGWAVHQTRVFKLRKDGTLNGEAIKAAVVSFIEHKQHIARMDAVQANDASTANDARLSVKAKLVQAGLDFGAYDGSTAVVKWSDISVKVEAKSTGVELTLPGLSAETAVAILKQLGITQLDPAAE